MDLVALGLTIRALRRRRGWRQTDLATSCGVSQALVTAIERGHSDRVALRTLLSVAGALDARLVMQIRWRGGDLERLLDSDHSNLVARMVEMLDAAGWVTQIEATYATYRASGSIDIAAWHAASRTVLVIEIKTEIRSGEATLRKLDEKVRIAPALVRERFGWFPLTIGRLLIVEEASTARRRVDAHLALFDAALPTTGRAVTRWLKRPDGPIAGRYFLSNSSRRSAIHRSGGRHRVRRTPPSGRHALASVAGRVESSSRKLEPEIPTILVGYQRREW